MTVKFASTRNVFFSALSAVHYRTIRTGRLNIQRKTHLFRGLLVWFRRWSVIVIVPRHSVCHFYCLGLHVWTLQKYFGKNQYRPRVNYCRHFASLENDSSTSFSSKNGSKRHGWQYVIIIITIATTLVVNNNCVADDTDGRFVFTGR